MKSSGLPAWRSLLYVPAHVDRFVEKASARGADAVILDLEDSVPATEKERAREKARHAAAMLANDGVDVLVRINRPWRWAIRDLEAVVGPGVRAVVVPKADSAAHIKLLGEVVGELERERDVPWGSTGVVALIESAEALRDAHAIAGADPRVVALMLGSEDFAAATGMDPDGEGVLYAKLQIVLAARACGIVPLGLAGSIANYKNAEQLRSIARKSRSLGFEGSPCVHPAQIPILNEAFSPSAEEVAHAQNVVQAYERASAQGIGALEVDGRMVDVPVVERARRVLERARRLGIPSGRV
ncbi:MAG: CoA ester lyase [Firmicutes bacterium]|nr:CoA ester lyase [Bacillota bacterium]